MYQKRPMTEAERRESMTQAIANASIEGFEPDTAFLKLADEVVRGARTHEDAIAIILAEGQAADKKARGV